MIEIRELVIRATVEDSIQNTENSAEGSVNENRENNRKCCSESIEKVLQIINDKKER